MIRAGTTPVEITRQPSGEGLPLPEPATPGSAGFDLAAAIGSPQVVEPGERVLVPTGFAIAVPEGYEAQVRPRSGLALRHGIMIPNAPGTIDSDYRGEVKVILMNAGTESFRVQRGDRIAQLVIAPVTRVGWVEVDELSPTERGSGGFGHTGVAASISENRSKPDE
jgi:dUTP pyrophosphatase